MTDIDCVVKAGAQIGESSIWDEKHHLLYWVDIPAKKLHRYEPESKYDAVWQLPEEPGAVALRASGGVVLAMRSGFYAFPFNRPDPILLARLEGEPKTNRLNDGRIDPAGRFWSGSVNEANRDPTGALYCLGLDHKIEKKIAEIGCSNSLCWSLDGKTMYHADSFTWRINAYDFDAATGAIANRRIFIDVPRDEGLPDGATVDAEDCLWVTHWGHGHLKRYDPKGALMTSIQMPVTNITCPAFGGRNLDVIYVTSATFRLTPEQKAQQPLAGGLFAVHAGVKGVVEKRYRG